MRFVFRRRSCCNILIAALLFCLVISSGAQSLQFTKLIDNTTPRPDAAQSGQATFGPFSAYDYSNPLGYTTPVTDGTTVAFNVGYFSGSYPNCAGGQENSIWTIPVKGGTPSLVAGWSINLEPSQPSTSATTTCTPIVQANGNVIFYGSYLTATQTTRSGYFAVPVAGGANSDVVASGDSVNGTVVTSPYANYGVAGGTAFMDLVVGPAGEQYLYQSTTSGVSLTNSYNSLTCGAGQLSQYDIHQYATDGTLFAAITDEQGLPDGSNYVVLESTGSLQPSCASIALSYGQGTKPPILALPGLVGTPTGDPTMNSISVASGRVFVQANQVLNDGTQYEGIFEVVGGNLVKIIGTNDTFPGIPVKIVQCRGYGPATPTLPDFTAAGNWLIARVTGSTTAICSSTQTYDTVQGIVAVNLTTGAVEKVVVDGDVIDSAGDIIGSVGVAHPGQVAPDGHAAFTFEIYNTNSNSPYYGGAYALYSTNLNALATQVNLTATPSPGSYENNVTLTATVSTVTSGGGTPTGTVQFLDGTTVLGTSTLSSGVATLTLDTLTAGNHSISVSYQGNDPYLPSTSTASNLSISQGTTSLALTTSKANVNQGASVTLTATLAVTSTGGTPTGNITFLDGGATLATVPLSGRTASYNTSSLAAGVHTLTAAYPGDTNFAGSAAAAVTETVTMPAFASTLTVTGASTLTYGTAPTVNVTVSGPKENTTVPTGMITATLDAGSPVTATLTQGAATLTLPATNAGTHTVVVSYSGDNNFGVSSQTYPLTVSPLGITASVNLAPSVVYGSVIPAISGSVSGELPADQSSISVVFSSAATSKSGVGSYPITGALTGPAAGNYSVTLNGTPAVTVTAAALTVQVNNATRSYGATNPTFSGTLTGAVNGDPLAASYSTTAATTSPVGTYPITATVTGTNSTDYSPQVTNGTLTVTKAGSTAQLSVSAASIGTGQSLMITAQVASTTSGTPTGTITFLDGTQTIGTGTLSNGSASLSLTTLPVGTHTLSISYSGNANFNSSTSTSTQVTVGTPDFNLNLTPASATIKAGQSATFTFTATSVFGYSQPISLSCSGLPSEAACNFSPSTLTPSAGGSTTVLTVTTTAAQASLDRRPGRLWPLGAPVLTAFVAFGFLRRRRAAPTLLLVMLSLSLVAAVGCGGSNNSVSNTPPNPGTPVGSDAVTVNATVAGATAKTAPITIIITQ